MDFDVGKRSPWPVVVGFIGLVVSFLWGTQNSILFYASLPSTVPEEGILVFYQPNCPHCIAEIPTIRKLVEMGYTVHAINVLERPDTALQFGVTQTPTIVILPSGAKLVGEQDLNAILEAIKGGVVSKGAACSVEVATCGVT